MKPIVKLFNGEEECPYVAGSMDFFIWTAEKSIVECPELFTKVYELTPPGNYPKWCKNEAKTIEERAMALTISQLVGAYANEDSPDLSKWLAL